MGLWAEMKPLLRDRLFPARIAPTKEGDPSPPVLFQMATGYWASQAIYVAAKLGIADLLKDEPQSCVALATATGADAPSLFRLMRALASVGVFSHVSRDCFALSRLAESLQTNSPASLRAMVITVGEIHYQACGTFFIVFKLDLQPSTARSEQTYSTTWDNTSPPRMRLIRA